MKQFFWIFSFLLLPAVGHAQVLISEVAWMGTDKPETGQYCEWIELYNDNSEDVDISGWLLTFGTASITFAEGTYISANDFFVVERYTENACPDPVSGITDYSKSFGASGLSNSPGTIITLTRLGGISPENTVDGSDDWKINVGVQAGNKDTKETAQRTRTGAWVTGVPTPGAENVQENALSTTTEESTDTDTETTTTHTQTSGGGGSSKTIVPKKVIPASNPVLSLSLTAPRIAYVNQEVAFEVEPQGIGKTFMNSLVYTWNFGDTYTATGKKNTHIFEYPGEYIVIVEGAFAKEKAQARVEINVLPISILLSRTERGDIQIKNNSKQEFDLGGFILASTGSFMFPKLTILKAGGALTISAKRINAQRENPVALYDALRTLVVRDEVTLPSENILALKNPTTQRRVTAISEVPVKNKAPVARIETVQASPLSTGTSEVKTEKTTFIPIGKFAARDESASQGFFQKIFSKVFGFFGM